MITAPKYGITHTQYKKYIPREIKFVYSQEMFSSKSITFFSLVLLKSKVYSSSSLTLISKLCVDHITLKSKLYSSWNIWMLWKHSMHNRQQQIMHCIPFNSTTSITNMQLNFAKIYSFFQLKLSGQSCKRNKVNNVLVGARRIGIRWLDDMYIFCRVYRHFLHERISLMTKNNVKDSSNWLNSSDYRNPNRWDELRTPTKTLLTPVVSNSLTQLTANTDHCLKLPVENKLYLKKGKEKIKG